MSGDLGSLPSSLTGVLLRALTKVKYVPHQPYLPNRIEYMSPHCKSCLMEHVGRINCGWRAGYVKVPPFLLAMP